MKRRIVFKSLLFVVTIVTALTMSSAAQTETDTASSKVFLPATLDKYYPPQSQAPVFLFAMLGMAQPFSGMVADVFENDFDNAAKNYENFKEIFIQNSKLVPEWTDKFKMEPIEKLGEAIASKDPSLIMPAVENVDNLVCHACHQINMPLVQQKYRWDDFRKVEVTDPVMNQNVKFKMMMMMMETNFTGIGNDLEQGQTENALKQFAGFKARFSAIGESCMNCHDSERLYFVSDDVQELINNLGTELNKPEINADEVNNIVNTIGQESCLKCHLVHVPAAYGQERINAY